MANIYFTKYNNGYWIGTFDASGTDTVLYMYRASYGYLAIGSTDNNNIADVCIDYKDSNDAPNRCFTMKYPENSTVVIISKIPIESASYYIQNENNEWIEPNPIHLITLIPSSHGNVSASSPYVVEGESVTITAIADNGYEFTKWSDNNTDNPRTITDINEDITLSAVFSKVVIPPTPPTPSVTPLFIEAKAASSTVSMMSMLTTAPNLEYSEDGTTFQEWQHTTSEGTHVFDTITLGAVGDKVYFRGTNAALADIQNNQMSVFMPTGNVKVGGSVQSLVDGTGESTTAIGMGALFASGMMGGSATALTEVESGLLPATTLADYCYSGMFGGCTSLTTAPTLPATTLADSCYTSMFYGCTSLTTAPTLPATTLSVNCYNSMFGGCTSLTTAPTLPATTLVEHCYFSMFYECSSLNSVTCLALSISANGCLKEWLGGVAATGTFIKAAGMSNWPSSISGIPSGWTVADYSA